MAERAIVRIGSADLTGWTARIFARRGLAEADARCVAEALVDADMRGVDTHGVAQIAPYLAWLEKGITKARPAIAIETRGAFLRVDADCALGQIAAARALDAAIAVAKREGAATTAISRTGHLGALGYFTRRAAEAGMIAVLMQNGPPLMAPSGARRRAIGNNPLSFAAPVAGRPPIVFDVATSEAAYGKIVRAAARGEAIPEGWAMDADGRPTSDARAAVAGLLIPSGGFKGVGLAMMIDILAGGLSATRPQWGGGIFGGFLMAVDPDAGAGRAAFDADVAAWLDHYEASGPGFRYPGAQSAERFDEAARDGVPLDSELADKLAALGDREGVSFPRAAASSP